MMGVIISQVMRLMHSPTPNPVLGYYVTSVPLAAICHSTALLISVMGAARYFRVQKEAARGNAVSGGWEISVIGILSLAVRHRLRAGNCF